MSSKSYSSVVQEDKSVQAAAEAQNILGAESKQVTAYPTSVIVSDAPDTTLGDIVFNQFPEAVQRTVADLVRMTETAVTTSSQAQLKSTQALGEKLGELQIGEAAVLPKIALYIALGGVALVIGLRMLKR